MPSSRMRGAAVLLMALNGGAWAADVAVPTHKGLPPPPVSVFSWQGFYVGAYLGGAGAETRSSDLTTPSFAATPTLNSSELTFGVLAGYNLAFDALVVGVEGEAGYDRRSASGVYQGAVETFTHRLYAESGDNIDRLRARVGYGADNVLMFVAGGVSFTDVNLSITNLANNSYVSIKNWNTGWNLGAGSEVALGGQWTLRAEYIYDGYPTSTFNFQPLGFDSRSINYHENTLRAVVGYKF